MRVLSVDPLGVTRDTSPLHSAGPVSSTQNDVYFWIFWASVVVFFGVATLIIYSAIRFRRRHDDDEPRQVHGNSRLEIAWTLIPLAILLSLFGYTASKMPFLASAPADSMRVCVEGQQFQWNYYYENSCGEGKLVPSGRRSFRPADKSVITSTSELYVPVGKPVALELVSSDVNHSYYVPRLAGQVNAIPGQVNHLWLQADAPGIYLGQCTELCGAGHAIMTLAVIALSDQQFQACMAQLSRKQLPLTQCLPPGGS